MKSSSPKSTLVYSTEHGKVCPQCSQPIAQCSCGQKKAVTTSDGVVKVSRETKGRNGKSVTVIKGVPLDPEALTAFAKSLKAACGSGGTLKDGVIEIQGDHTEMLMAKLKARGWVVKRSGG